MMPIKNWFWNSLRWSGRIHRKLVSVPRANMSLPGIAKLSQTLDHSPNKLVPGALKKVTNITLVSINWLPSNIMSTE